MAEQYKRNPNTRCSICKKQMYRRPSEIKNTKNKLYCSLLCYGLSCRKERSCIVCKKPILSGLHRKTCSRACSNKNRVLIKYKVGRPRDKAVLARSMKLRLFEKRGRICERCGYSEYRILEVHHKDRDHQNNNFDNLELICPNCHSLEHLFYKNNKNEGGVA